MESHGHLQRGIYKMLVIVLTHLMRIIFPPPGGKAIVLKPKVLTGHTIKSTIFVYQSAETGY